MKDELTDAAQQATDLDRADVILGGLGYLLDRVGLDNLLERMTCLLEALKPSLDLPPASTHQS
jgi:hypothetical protein